MNLSPNDSDIFQSWKERRECDHPNWVSIDTEIIRITNRLFEIYDIRKCSKGHVFKIFIKTHRILNLQ